MQGRGFVLIRGLPRERYSNGEMWPGLLGHRRASRPALAAEAKGHLLGDVTDQGKAAATPPRAATSWAKSGWNTTATART